MAETDPNVVLVTADSLRADHCGHLGCDRSLTPAIDALAADGVAFERAVAPGPRTPISVPESMTGSPMATIRDCSDEERGGHIAAHVAANETLPERLSARGYATAAVNANPWTSSWTGFDDCFDEFVDESDVQSRSPAVRSVLSVAGGTELGTLALWGARWVHRSQFFSQWPALYGSVERLIESLPEPYFLWVFLMDTHSPYIAPRRFREESSTLGLYTSLLRGNRPFTAATGDSTLRPSMPRSVHVGLSKAYRDAVRSVDGFVERLRADLDEDALLAVHADHGEAFGEHGSYGHQQALYEENLRVPLVVSGPGVPAGERVADPFSLRSLTSMLLDAADGGLRPDDWTDEFVVSRTQDGRRIAVTDGDVKYALEDETERVHDLDADPLERRNLLETTPGRADEEPSIDDESDESGDDGAIVGADRFRAVREAFEAEVPRSAYAGDRPERQLSQSRADLLKQLGYR